MLSKHSAAHGDPMCLFPSKDFQHNIWKKQLPSICKSSQDLFKHPTNKNHHNHLQNQHQIHFNMKFVKPSKIK